MFYVFSYIVIIVRISLAIMIFRIAIDYEDYGLNDKFAVRTKVAFLILQVIVAYAKICMGFY